MTKDRKNDKNSSKLTVHMFCANAVGICGCIILKITVYAISLLFYITYMNNDKLFVRELETVYEMWYDYNVN